MTITATSSGRGMAAQPSSLSSLSLPPLIINKHHFSSRPRGATMGDSSLPQQPEQSHNIQQYFHQPQQLGSPALVASCTSYNSFNFQLQQHQAPNSSCTSSTQPRASFLHRDSLSNFFLLCSANSPTTTTSAPATRPAIVAAPQASFSNSRDAFLSCAR